MQSGRCKAWLYKNAGEIIGFGSLGPSKWPILSETATRKISLIPWMGIDARFRGLPEGVPKLERYCSQIIDDLIDEALKKAATRPHIGLCVHPDNHLAIALYRRHEFADYPIDYVDPDTKSVYKRMFLAL